MMINELKLTYESFHIGILREYPVNEAPLRIAGRFRIWLNRGVHRYANPSSPLVPGADGPVST